MYHHPGHLGNLRATPELAPYSQNKIMLMSRHTSLSLSQLATYMKAPAAPLDVETLKHNHGGGL